MLADFRKKGREGGREGNIVLREKYWMFACMQPDWGLNPGDCMRLDWESKPWPFGLWDSIPTI